MSLMAATDSLRPSPSSAARRAMTHPATKLKASDRGAAIAGALVAALLTGCSYDGASEQQPRQGVIDHLVPHVSTERANAGARVNLFVRERRSAPNGPVVLFVQGRSAATVPAFDLDYRDYSWLAYLADAGFHVFAMDLQGYGRSSRPAVMDDACNTSAENQSKYLVSKPLQAPCPPIYPHAFGSFATDWDEIDTVVEFIRSVRGGRSLKVNLVGWSRGGMRAIGYAALRPDNVERIVAFAPTRFPPVAREPTYPMHVTDKRDFFSDWDRQIDAGQCPQQVDPSIREALWTATMAQDELGRGWGASGVRRSPAFTAAGWTSDLPGRVRAPTLVVRGALDDQAPEHATRALYEALGGPKAYVTVSCGSHELVYEKQHTTLLQASVEWLQSGKYDSRRSGPNLQ